MAVPTSSQATLRPDLATFMQLDLEMQRRGYVATRLMAPFEVPNAFGPFKLIKLKSLLAQANADTKRSAKGGFNQGEYEFDEASYSTKEYGWKEPIDDTERAMYANFLDMEEVAAMRAWEVLLNGLEARVIAKAIDATVTASRSAAATAVWTNHASAVPMDDVQAARRAVWLRTGRRPNTVCMAYEDFEDCRRCAQVTDAIAAKGSGDRIKPQDINAAMLAQVFDVEQVVVADAIKNTANIGQTASISSLWPEGKVFLGVTSNSIDFKSPCFGRIMHWGGAGSRISANESMIGTVDQYRDEDMLSDVIRVRHQTDENVLYAEMAQVITGVRS